MLMVFRGIKKLSSEVRKNVGAAIVGAFAFIIALVWRDVIVGLVKDLMSFLNLTGSSFIIQLMAAFMTTFICVLGILYFSGWSEKK